MEFVGRFSYVHLEGPWEAYVEGFSAELIRLGFEPTSRDAQLRLMAHLSRWLQARGLMKGNLTVELVKLFLLELKASFASHFTYRALKPMLTWLAESGRASGTGTEGAHGTNFPHCGQGTNRTWINGVLILALRNQLAMGHWRQLILTHRSTGRTDKSAIRHRRGWVK